MIKNCKICGSEFETNNPNKKYCSVECRQERIREYDRARKQKARQEAKKVKLAELEQKRKERAAKERAYQKELEAKQHRLVAKAKRGDPWARMQLAKPFSYDYWEAYKDYEINNSLQYENNPIRYVNGISVHDDYFADKVIITIEELGLIYSELIESDHKNVIVGN